LLCCFFLYIFFFSINLFFLISFYNFKFFSILLSHFYNTTLQPDPLKLGSWKFNIIINIIKITLESGVAVRSKALGYSFVEKPNTLRFYFIFNFFYIKKIDPQRSAATQLIYMYICSQNVKNIRSDSLIKNSILLTNLKMKFKQNYIFLHLFYYKIEKPSIMFVK
jgi:hypothetical protein